MGTWTAPTTAKDRNKLRRARKALRHVHKDIAKVFGDDRIEDAFIELQDRLLFALKSKWTHDKGCPECGDCSEPTDQWPNTKRCTTCQTARDHG